ncbi:uncharacterized protein A1O9_02348 [Exophiala aquamarina CBS 119918]|uniref:Uncharacterized protein n=1 Tax=Exophiala aquamarina CBS 119918 TaxID=1182545 RepID=A0A072PLR7_9EURO|nr:uncharacterized protein A1O9_02348 [Exophiala aquamarina CBS 119918]KEF60786.1 hypothetical protein A1O9_02348 [Exophiala aquamarina CBS 119918]
MSDDPNFDHDAAMREAMGFSSFAVRRPKDDSFPTQPDLRDQPQEHNEDMMTASTRGSFNTYSGTENPSRDSLSVHESAPRSPEIVFTSSATNTNYTKAELDVWARGKRNLNGDLVFFKPGFISEDPWSRLRDKTENSA